MRTIYMTGQDNMMCIKGKKKNDTGHYSFNRS